MGKNRYGFKGISADAVHGDTFGMTLSGGMGKTKKVENLTEPIRLVIPNKVPQPPPVSYNAYCTLMLNVHLVESKVNESVVIMHIKPNPQQNENHTIEGEIGFFAFMNKGDIPNVPRENSARTRYFFMRMVKISLSLSILNFF